ncbi:unnamed protein product [Auanema sp. JU1783]|nr:unnamed protein product [Auanema sp. JU1783]
MLYQLILCQLLIIPIVLAIAELPLAPYNVKIYCRQGIRYTKQSQAAVQCPSSSTACGYFEFKAPNKQGEDKTGLFDCVDAGILALNESADEEDYADAKSPLFSELCGTMPGCSTINLDILNPAFTKYLVTHYGLRLEEMSSTTIRFCCSLYYSTLQKLVISGYDKLPSVSAPPVHCGAEVCGQGAIGCLLHQVSSTEDEEEYEEDGNEVEDDSQYHLKRRRRFKELLYVSEEDYGVNAVQLDFDDDVEDLTIITTTQLPSTTTAKPLVKKQHKIKKPIETPHWPEKKSNVTKTNSTLPSLKLPYGEVDKKRGSSVKTKNGVKYAVIDEDFEEDDDYEEGEETHCVYRHLNDELYRYCMLVHQMKDGERCFHHRGHTICCCFVPPDRETCDPTEPELTLPPTSKRLPSKILVTAPTYTVTSRPVEISTTSTTTTTTSTTTTSTTPAPTTAIKIRTNRISYMNRKSPCRAVYHRSKTKGVTRTIVCDLSFQNNFNIFIVAISFLLQVLFYN